MHGWKQAFIYVKTDLDKYHLKQIWEGTYKK